MKQKSEISAAEAYKRLIPPELIEMMELGGVEEIVPGGHIEKRMTIMFCDIRDFTAHTERMSPQDSLGFVNSVMGAMEPVIRRGGGIIDKYIGDAVMAIFPGPSEDGVNTAVSMIEALGALNVTRAAAGRRLVRAGIGLNTGLAMVGAVGGNERMDPTVISDAVNLASRLESLTKDYSVPIIISEHTYYGLKGPRQRKIRFLDRIRVKGKSQPQSVYEVFENDAPATAAAKERMKAKFEEAAAYYHLRVIDRAKKLFSECLEAVPEDKPAKFYLDRCELFELAGKHEGTGELDGTLEWRDEFSVGIATIDAQHKVLLSNMNKVAPLIRNGDTSKLEELFAFLVKYASYHFNYEEGLMERGGYKFYDVQRAEHQRFSAYLSRLSQEVTSSAHERLFLIFKVQIFLSDWFACHSTGMDRHLAIYLNGGEGNSRAG